MMTVSETVKKFRAGNWMNKAQNFIKNPQKLKNLGDEIVVIIKDKGLREVKDQLLLMKDYVVDVATGKYKNYSVSSLLIVVAGLIYVVTPVDLIPDFLPIVGWTDDVTVVGWVFSEIQDELQRYKRYR